MNCPIPNCGCGCYNPNIISEDNKPICLLFFKKKKCKPITIDPITSKPINNPPITTSNQVINPTCQFPTQSKCQSKKTTCTTNGKSPYRKKRTSAKKKCKKPESNQFVVGNKEEDIINAYKAYVSGFRPRRLLPIQRSITYPLEKSNTIPIFQSIAFPRESRTNTKIKCPYKKDRSSNKRTRYS